LSIPKILCRYLLYFHLHHFGNPPCYSIKTIATGL
jgi:hypothetical protein